MADITTLILADHEWLREQFARLDYLQARTSVKAEQLQQSGVPWPTSRTCTHTSKRRSSIHSY